MTFRRSGGGPNLKGEPPHLVSVFLMWSVIFFFDGQLRDESILGTPWYTCGRGEGRTRHSSRMALNGAISSRKKSMLLVAGKPMGPDLLVQGKLETFVR